MNPISFCANYKSFATILSGNNKNRKEEQVFIAELDKDNGNDIEAMLEASLLWDKENNNNLSSILSDFVKDIDEKPDVNADHCLVLTLQNNDFGTLDAEKILGAILFSEQEFSNEINWFQVEPKNNHFSSENERKYRKIGDSLLKYLLSNFKSKRICVNSTPDAIKFYQKYGFKPYDIDYPTSLYYDA